MYGPFPGDVQASPARRRHLFTLLAIFGTLIGSTATASADDTKLPRPQLHMVPMTDGVRLATDVYLPEGHGPFPTIFLRGPYGRSGVKFLLPATVGRGYALVSQDVRGKGDSEGEASIIFGDGGLGDHPDGHDAIRWIAQQSWCNGAIGTLGGSALGITQVMLAPSAPPSLRAQVVEVAFSDFYSQGAYQGGVWRKELLEVWLEANRLTALNLPHFRAHPAYDAFWERLDAQAHAAQVDCPGVFVGGWYDIFLQGTINSFLTIHHQGGPRARGNCRLIIGPWAHGTFDELRYPDNANQRPQAASFERFFAHWLQGEDNGVPSDPAVHYYVMGDPTDPEAPGNEWRAADAWPPAAEAQAWYLHADGRFDSRPPDEGGRALAYRYDPRNPVPTLGGQNLTIPKGPMDQQSLEQRSDVLVFTSGALAEPLEITGPLSARIFVSSDCPDTDFTVKLSDVYPDGRSMLVCDGIRRAKFRRSYREPEPLTPGQIYEIEVDLWSTSLIVNRGHRLRIAISSSNVPRFEQNSNTLDDQYDRNRARVATNTLYCTREHASRVILPIVGAAPQQ